MRELTALAGPVQCEQPAGAVNLVLRGHARAERGALPGAPLDTSVGLTEVLFSGATQLTLPAGLHDVRVIEMLDAPAPTTAAAAAMAPSTAAARAATTAAGMVAAAGGAAPAGHGQIDK
jgi:hypothetical protein